MLMRLKILHSKMCLLFLYLCASVYSLYSPGSLNSLYATKQEKEKKKVYKVFKNNQLSSICDSPRPDHKPTVMYKHHQCVCAYGF